MMRSSSLLPSSDCQSGSHSPSASEPSSDKMSSFSSPKAMAGAILVRFGVGGAVAVLGPSPKLLSGSVLAPSGDGSILSISEAREYHIE